MPFMYFKKIEIACAHGKSSLNKKSETSFVPNANLCNILQLWQNMNGN